MRRVVIIISYSSSKVSSALKRWLVGLYHGGQALEYSVGLEQDLQLMAQARQEKPEEELLTISLG